MAGLNFAAMKSIALILAALADKQQLMSAVKILALAAACVLAGSSFMLFWPEAPWMAPIRHQYMDAVGIAFFGSLGVFGVTMGLLVVEKLFHTVKEIGVSQSKLAAQARAVEEQHCRLEALTHEQQVILVRFELTGGGVETLALDVSQHAVQELIRAGILLQGGYAGYGLYWCTLSETARQKLYAQEVLTPEMRAEDNR